MRPRLGGLPYLADRETRLGGLPHLSCKHDQIKMRDYMERRVTPPRRVTSPTWGPPPPCKQALKDEQVITFLLSVFMPIEVIFARTAHSREFAFVFVLLHVSHHKMYTFGNYLHEVNSKFQNNRHYGCEEVEVLCFVLSYLT